MNLLTVLAALLSSIFILLSAIHIYWAMGGTWGASSAIPTQSGKPLFEAGKGATLLVATALLIAAGLVLGRIDLITLDFLPEWLLTWGVWGLAGAFLLRGIGEFNYVGLFKKHKTSQFAYWDTRIFSPLCLFISLCALLINLLSV